MISEAPYSPARKAGGFLFVSGQLGVDASGQFPAGVQAQTAQAIANLSAVLEANKARLSDVVKCQVFLASIDDWAAMNEVYRQQLGTPFPARSAIAVGLPPGALIEIEAIAHVG